VDTYLGWLRVEEESPLRLVHHSDQGVQYLLFFAERLKEVGIRRWEGPGPPGQRDGESFVIAEGRSWSATWIPDEAGSRLAIFEYLGAFYTAPKLRPWSCKARKTRLRERIDRKR